MLLNQPDPTTTTTTTNTNTNNTNNTTTTTTVAMENKSSRHEDHHHRSTALFAAAQSGHTDCVKLLLASGASADDADENGFTPLHFAAAHGRLSCVEALLCAGATVDVCAAGGQTPLFMASEAGSPDCVRVLLSAGADRSRATADSCTPLHAAVSSGHVETLRVLLLLGRRGLPPDPAAPRPPDPAPLLNRANAEGWTAAHMAAARGFKECLEVLCGHSEQDIERRDKCNRTIHDVATDDCKDLLENLHSYRVQVRLQLSGGGGSEPMCPVEALEEEGGSAGGAPLGRVCVERATRWAQLGLALGQALGAHLRLLCQEDPQPAPPLGLTPHSIGSALIGDTVWLPGQELALSPWDLVRKPFGQHITVRLKGLSESCLDELALESLIPLPLLHNYVRLVEQYGNLIFHGLEGSCQEYLANQIARCIKHKQEAGGVCCDVVHVEVDGSLTKEQLLETFINCGFLVPAGGGGVPEGVGGSGCVPGRCVVVLLEGLEKASSLPGLLGDLCQGLDTRGSACPLALLNGPHHFQESGFLIGTLSKPRLQGSELRLQQHFRWVTLRWDQEPLHGLLGRHLRRKLIHKKGTGKWAPDGPLERTVVWVSHVWQQLNACLSRLGTHEALLGPQLFLSCPVVPDNTQAVVKWLARLWNAVVVPRVEEAIISRVTVKRPLSSSSQRPSLSNRGLSQGQQAVVKAALSIVVNKAVLQNCPLPRHEIDRHLLEFQGGTFPMSAIGSCKGSAGSGRKGRDAGMWRRANTSPRKKGSPASSWNCSGSLREGSRSNTDVRFIANGNSQSVNPGEPVGLAVFSDDETDLIRELQTMCSSRSEPDISKMAQSKEDFLLFSSSPSGPVPSKHDHEVSGQARPQSAGTRPYGRSAGQAAPLSGDKRSAPRAKSQLPVPSSRGQQQPQPRGTSSSSSSTGSRSQTPTNRSSRTEPLGKTRQAPPINNNNHHHRNSVNDNSQQHEDIWILHRDLHENMNNNNNSKK